MELESIKRQSYILYLLPAVVILAAFLIYPVYEGVRLSTFIWDGFSPKRYVGLQNFGFIFKDPVFRLSLYHSLIVAIMGPLVQTTIGIFLALMISEATRGKTLYKVIHFFPIILSLVAITVIWSWIYAPTEGLLNVIIVFFGGNSVDWLGPDYSLYSLIAIAIWRYVGFNMLLLLSGIQTIDPSLREAAAVDGATRWGIIRNITLPLLRPFITMNVVINIIGYLNFFDIIYVSTKGGPANSSQVLPVYAFVQGFENNSFGTASATGVILFIVAALLMFIYFRIMRKSSLS
jgi:raffinose/stachyose/melibiose transport system permease protein